MKKLTFLSAFLLIFMISTAQNSNLSIKVGILNSKTKTQQINPTSPLNFVGFESRTGGVFGLRYSYKLSRYLKLGTELQYLLKGHTSTRSGTIFYSNHYLGLSPFIAFHPFANARSKYLSGISPELSFDYNYSLGTNAPWEKYSNINFYRSETGYSFKLSYQPARLGIQVFHFRALTPFLKSQWGDPSFDDLKFNFVSGVSVLYKFGNRPSL